MEKLFQENERLWGGKSGRFEGRGDGSRFYRIEGKIHGRVHGWQMGNSLQRAGLGHIGSQEPLGPSDDDRWYWFSRTFDRIVPLEVGGHLLQKSSIFPVGIDRYSWKPLPFLIDQTTGNGRSMLMSIIEPANIQSPTT